MSSAEGRGELGQTVARYAPAAGTLNGFSSRSGWRRLVRYAQTKPLGTFAAAVILALVLMAVTAPLIEPWKPNAAIAQNLAPPTLAHPFGTDTGGHDLLSRVIEGSRASLYTSVVAVLFGTLGGTALGILSAEFGGWFDMLVQRLIDAALAIPILLLAIVIVSLVKPSLNNVLVALSIAIAPRTSRIVRSETLSVKAQQYVDAATAVGCGHIRLMLRYVLPNILPTILIVASLTMGGAIIAESSLAFLGLTSPTLLDWGGMLSTGRTSMENAWWTAVFPGLAIMITVLAFNLLGDALRDVLDPRLRVG